MDVGNLFLGPVPMTLGFYQTCQCHKLLYSHHCDFLIKSVSKVVMVITNLKLKKRKIVVLFLLKNICMIALQCTTMLTRNHRRVNFAL